MSVELLWHWEKLAEQMKLKVCGTSARYTVQSSSAVA